MNKDIWVISEKNALQAELLAAAQTTAQALGGEAAAVVIGNTAQVESALAQGAQQVFHLGESGGRMLEDYTATLAELVRAHQPAGLLIGATVRGKALAGRLAAALGLTAVSDIKHLAVVEGELHASHLILGGGAVRVEKSITAPLIATAGLGIFEPLSASSGSGQVTAVAFIDQGVGWQLRERKPNPPATVNLAAAKKVVCPGRGVQQREDLEMIFTLARLLGGEVGATRPLCEGLDWLPRERYIGVSGAFIKPDLYLGVGVSGQVQHTVGIREARVVAAINKDAEAPIFDQADYGIVGDLYVVLPELIKALQARQ